MSEKLVAIYLLAFGAAGRPWSGPQCGQQLVPGREKSRAGLVVSSARVAVVNSLSFAAGPVATLRPQYGSVVTGHGLTVVLDGVDVPDVADLAGSHHVLSRCVGSQTAWMVKTGARAARLRALLVTAGMSPVPAPPPPRLHGLGALAAEIEALYSALGGVQEEPNL
jgi:hypothetical protein